MRACIDPDGQRVSRARPPLPRRPDADPDHLGHRRPGDPGRARPQRPRDRRPTAATSRSRAPATGRCSTLPSGSSRELTAFIEETEPFEYSIEQVRERLRRGPALGNADDGMNLHRPPRPLPQAERTRPRRSSSRSRGGAVMALLLLADPGLQGRALPRPRPPRRRAPSGPPGCPAGRPCRERSSASTLLVAVFGMYWDISLHIDDGRDPGPLANPAHYFILAGLFGVFIAGVLGVALADQPTRTSFKIAEGWHAPIGAVMIVDLRRRLALRLPARRRLAPHLRPGRDPLGSDPPDADRRRLALDARRLGASRRGRRGAPRGGPPASALGPRPRVHARRAPSWSGSRPSRPSSTSACRSSRCCCSRC